jgi:HAD superfamily hydrolase (TIGR01509 family)
MDGVIIDSEPMHVKAAVLALKKYHVDVTANYIDQFIGSTTKYMCRKMTEEFNLSISPEELLSANEEMRKFLLKTEGLTVIPYVVDLMKDLHNNGIKLSIASSSSSSDIEEVMNTLKIRQYFDSYVSGEAVSHPKPAPDIFLAAAERLGAAPSECIVIEDSFNGVAAAEAAGMTSIGFINPNSGRQDLRKASMLVEGFDEVDYEFINKVYQYSHLLPATILTTEHFILRELSVEDIDEMYQLCKEPDIRRFLDNYSGSLEIEKEKHRSYIENIYHFYGYGLWGVFSKESGNLAGRCGVELKQLDGEKIYEIGYLLSKPLQGHGYAKEFVTAVINYCFHELNIQRIIAVIDINNERSIHLAEQVGMHRLGDCIRNNHNCFKYEITYHA